MSLCMYRYDHRESMKMLEDPPLVMSLKLTKHSLYMYVLLLKPYMNTQLICEVLFIHQVLQTKWQKLKRTDILPLINIVPSMSRPFFEHKVMQ